MADVLAQQTGDWSDPDTWPGGTLPTEADDVYANGFDVTIDINVKVASIRTTEPSGGSIGGQFLLTNGSEFEGDIHPELEFDCLLFDGNGAAKVVGGSIFTAPGSGSVGAHAVVNSGGGELEITATLVQGSGGVSGSTGYDRANLLNQNGEMIVNADQINDAGGQSITVIANLAQGEMTINGTVEGCTRTTSGQTKGGVYNAGELTVIGGVFGRGGGNNNQQAAIWNSNGKVVVVGDFVAETSRCIHEDGNAGEVEVTGDCRAIDVSCIDSSASTLLDVVGEAEASTTRAAFVKSSPDATNILTGPFINASNGRMAVQARKLLLRSGVPTRWQFRTTDLDETRDLLSPDQPEFDRPDTSDVRQGVTYGPEGVLEGTMAVPPAETVAFGVPVDDGLGQAAIARERPIRRAAEVW